MVQVFSVFAAFLLALSVPRTISAPVLSEFGSGINFNSPTYHCNTAPEWGSPSFRPDDCRQVVSDFVHSEVVQLGEQRFEFVSLGARPVTGLQRQYIPYRYIHGELAPTTEQYDHG